MAISMAPALSQVVVYVGKSDVSIFNQMAVDNTSKQLSCSWGWSDNESSLDPIFKEMAVQGQSVFVATGDNGSGTPGDVVWPSDDPYVTAVGGTDLTTTGPGGAWLSETGWNGSAGSPSTNTIPSPSYQKLKGVINSLNQGSTTLRNYPGRFCRGEHQPVQLFRWRLQRRQWWNQLRCSAMGGHNRDGESTVHRRRRIDAGFSQPIHLSNWYWFGLR